MASPLLYFILPLATVLFIYDIGLGVEVAAMDKKRRNKIFGGLHGPAYHVWLLTFVFSSVGVVWSFIYHEDNTDSFTIVLIFLLMDCSLILYNYGLLAQHTGIVLVTLSGAVLSYIFLFLYTLWCYPPKNSHDSLIYLHACNFVCVIHGVLLDYCIWQVEWRKNVFQDKQCMQHEVLFFG